MARPVLARRDQRLAADELALVELDAEADAALVAPGTAVAIEIFGEWVEGEVAAEPLFDQAGERIRS